MEREMGSMWRAWIRRGLSREKKATRRFFFVFGFRFRLWLSCFSVFGSLIYALRSAYIPTFLSVSSSILIAISASFSVRLSSEEKRDALKAFTRSLCLSRLPGRF